MAQITLGPIALRVANIEKQVRFYQETIGLRVQRQAGDTIYMGAGANDLLALIHRPNAARPQRRGAGLYHFALLLPQRSDLAQSLQHFIDLQTPMQGASDHIVSEALYLPDAEGNGIEIYWDRPREAWFKNGEMQLATLPLDAEGVLRELPSEAWSGLPDDTVMGHVHLHVNDIPQARAFYSDWLGMDVMFNVRSALFMSYEGYHHHLGANIWSGRTPAPADALGLAHYEISYHSAVERDAIVARLQAAGVELTESEAGYLVRDPAQNQLLLSTA